MRKIFIPFILASMFSNTMYSQGRILIYNEVNNTEFLKTIQKDEKIDGFTLQTGDTVRVGCLVKLGKPFTDMRQNVALLNINTNAYSSIFIGKPELSSFYPNLYFMPVGYEGDTALLTEIVVLKINKKKPAILLLNLKLKKTPDSKQFCMPESFDKGELYLVGGRLTKEQALTKLKEAKEKLNLELITQKEYDDLKVKLGPIILNGK